MNKSLLIITILLLVAGLATAAGFSKTQDGSNNCDTLVPGRTCYYDFSDTTDPKVLTLDDCSTVTYWLDPDEDGDSTGAKVQPYRCSEATFSTNHCIPIYNEGADGNFIKLPLDGDTDFLHGRRAENVTYLAFDVTANPSSDDARIMARCDG